MKVVITGSGGQLGRSLLKSVPAGWLVTGFAHAQLDITDPLGLLNEMQRQRPDLIINASAYTAVDKAESDRETAERVNAVGPQNLAAAAAAVGARLAHISTDFVFDGLASRPYLPEALTNPQSVYGLTKLAGETAVIRSLADHSVVLRTAWVYAATGNNFVRTMLRLMSTKGHVRVVADQVGTPTDAGSLAQAIWAIARAPGIKGIHHWTDLGVASWYDFAVAIAEEARAIGLLTDGVQVDPIATEEYPTPARRPSYSVLDKTSLLKELPLSSRHWRVNLRAVLREIANA
jgi:dTDP-4-dehydrorhamnose reductase